MHSLSHSNGKASTRIIIYGLCIIIQSNILAICQYYTFRPPSTMSTHQPSAISLGCLPIIYKPHVGHRARAKRKFQRGVDKRVPLVYYRHMLNERGIDKGLNQKGDMPMKHYAVRITAETKEDIEKIAKVKRRKTADYVRMVLEDAVKAEKEKGTI